MTLFAVENVVTCLWSRNGSDRICNPRTRPDGHPRSGSDTVTWQRRMGEKCKNPPS